MGNLPKDDRVTTQANPGKKQSAAQPKTESKSTRTQKEGGMKSEGHDAGSASAREKFPRSENF